MNGNESERHVHVKTNLKTRHQIIPFPCSKRNAKGSSLTITFHLNWGKGTKCLMTIAVVLSTVALPIIPEFEFNFRVILYFIFLSLGACLESTIDIQT